MPLFDKMNASLQRERCKGMHHISKSILFATIKVTDLCSASQNLSEKYIYMFQCEMGVQVKKYRLSDLCQLKIKPNIAFSATH